MKTRVKTISASEFKAKCLQIFDELGSDGIVVEKRGKPVAKVIPYPQRDSSSLIGCMKDEITINGDILSTGIEWDAES